MTAAPPSIDPRTGARLVRHGATGLVERGVHALAMRAGRVARDARRQIHDAGATVLTLQRGMYGQEVRRIQRLVGAAADGQFGPATASAVASWQAAHGVVDEAPGVAGLPTQRALCSQVLLGVDLSHWQGDVDFGALKASGVAWAMLKASQRGVAKRFCQNRLAARAAGVPVGVYHFAVTDRPASWNRAQLMSAVGLHYDLELPPVLDVEDREMRDPARLLAWTRETLAELADATGRRPLLYTSWSLLRDHMGGRLDAAWRERHGYDSLPEIADLWVVRYNGRPDPDDIGPWGEWALWQWSNDGRRRLGLRGVESRGLDVNWMAGGQFSRLLNQ